MKILVTGGTGYLGTALLARLVEQGHQVRVFVRKTSNTSEVPSGAETLVGNVTVLDSLLAAAEGVECVIHAAALVAAWARHRREFDKVNVEGLENVLQVLRMVPSVKRVVHISSFFALGPSDGGELDGSENHKGTGFCSDYERTKYLADGVAMRAAKDEGLDVVVVYPGVIYGPGKVCTSNMPVKLVVDYFHGMLPGYVGTGKGLMCFVHVDDVVSGILEAMEKGQPGQRYVLGGDNESLMGLFEVVREVTGKAGPTLHIPIPVAKVLGAISVFVARLGGPVPLFTPKSVQAFSHDWAYSSKVAEQQLGYTHRSLREGLGETLAGLREKGIIKY